LAGRALPDAYKEMCGPAQPFDYIVYLKKKDNILALSENFFAVMGLRGIGGSRI
jgi:hypothetical protein